MSMELFPTLPGEGVKLKRLARYSTSILRSPSGKEMRAAWRSSPIYDWEITYNFLRQDFTDDTRDELLKVVDFFHRHRGRYDSFRLLDTTDGIERRARFATDDLDLERFLMRSPGYPDPVWKGSIKFTGVL